MADGIRRLVFCFDGTWNRLTADDPTNVVLTAEMILPTASDGTPQIVYYDEGIGTGKWEKWSGGMFGQGMWRIVREAYRFLIFNYRPGDEIFAFGFSRGAFTARSFMGFIRHAGIIDADSASRIDDAIAIYKAAARGDGDDRPDALRFRAQYARQCCVSDWDRQWRAENVPELFVPTAPKVALRYLGVWDSVAALGWPPMVPFATALNRRRHTHDVKLTSKVQAARHAVAIDERRRLFEPVTWNNVAELNAAHGTNIYNDDEPYQQKWFPGTHGSVGGGGPVRGLSDSALVWVLHGARAAGLQIRTDPGARAFAISPDALASVINVRRAAWHDRGIVGALKHRLLSRDRPGPDDIAHVSASAIRRWRTAPGDLPEKQVYRPGALGKVAGDLDAIEYKTDVIEHVVEAGETLSKIAKRYLGDARKYRDIVALNPDLIDDPDELIVGSRLRVPRLT